MVLKSLRIEKRDDIRTHRQQQLQHQFSEQQTLNNIKTIKYSLTTMSYSDIEVSDDDSTSPQPQQEQQSTDQSPPSSMHRQLP